MTAMAAERKRTLFEAFYAGRTIEEFDRKVVVAVDELAEDLFGVEEDDLKAWIERYDEQQRNPTDGIQGSGQA